MNNIQCEYPNCEECTATHPVSLCVFKDEGVELREAISITPYDGYVVIRQDDGE